MIIEEHRMNVDIRRGRRLVGRCALCGAQVKMSTYYQVAVPPFPSINLYICVECAGPRYARDPIAYYRHLLRAYYDRIRNEEYSRSDPNA